MTVTFQSNIDAFNRALSDYLAVTRLSTQEATKKKAGDFSFRLAARLKQFMPAKGSIRKERLGALKSGSGVRVRPSVLRQVYSKLGVLSDIKTKKLGVRRRGKFTQTVRSGGKRLSIQAIAIKRELNLRESGRGFLSFSTKVKSIINKFPVRDRVNTQEALLDRGRRFLTSVGFKVDEDSSTISFNWGGNKSSGEIAAALSKPRQQKAIGTALDESREDMMAYIIKRQARAKWKLKTI